MNPTLTTIYERRAIRKFKNQPVEKELIDQLIEAGKMAPSAINRQPWKFYVLQNKEKILKFSHEIVGAAVPVLKNEKVQGAIEKTLSFLHLGGAFAGDDPIFHGAPVVIFLTCPKKEEWGALDVGMCAQNMMLAAKSLGLDTCPVGFAQYIEKTPDYSLLNIPDSEEMLIAIVVGYGDEHPDSHKRVGNTTVYLD